MRPRLGVPFGRQRQVHAVMVCSLTVTTYASAQFRQALDWIPYLSRRMVPRERLASLAFPVTQGSADVLGVPPCLSSMSIEQKLFAEMP